VIVDKRLIVIAGPNGAGKTTFARDYLQEYPADFLSADDLALKISPDHPESAKIEAGRLFSKKLQESFRSGKSVVIESTLSGKSMHRILDQAREAGYGITIAFIFLGSAQACIDRVRERVEKGGHDVPDSDILRRFYRSRENFWATYKHEVDLWFLFYNSAAAFEIVAFGEKDDYDVTDEKLFNIFLRDMK
jgi:predicted ABC-type ATPase